MPSRGALPKWIVDGVMDDRDEAHGWKHSAREGETGKPGLVRAVQDVESAKAPHRVCLLVEVPEQVPAARGQLAEHVFLSGLVKRSEIDGVSVFGESVNPPNMLARHRTLP